MKRDTIDKVIETLEFNQNSNLSSLFFTSQQYNQKELFFEERLVLDVAKKLNASAVFFRRFADSQTSKPQLFIFDNTTNKFSTNQLAELHRKIWSSGIIPLYYVFDKTNINIYDARKQVKYDKGTKTISIDPFESLPLITDSYKQHQKYSARLFANGSFWEQKEFANNFLSKETSENKLIEGLKDIRKHFISESGLDSNLAHQLLVLSILVKYLEERKDEHGNHVFPNNYFNKYQNSTSFCDVLRKGKVVELFDDLSTHFNGKVFQLNNNEKLILSKANLNQLAYYLDGNIDNGQLVIWPLYSFEYLPVELISRIYEEFVDQRSDAVYTPIHLARLMVDECMPISEPKQNYKVIDVSCGSGVFLVAVFKRLVQWWQKERFDKTGILEHPTVDNLKAILKNSVHGVDIEEASVKLSVFSLSIALCDMLTPTEIWMNLRFDDLRERNIYEGDFFEYLSKTEKEQFDLAIGNPPFEDKKKNFGKLLDKFNINSEYHIPRNQIAMLFLQQAMQLLKPNGLLSFVMPSGPLLYNNTLEFRKEFFSRYKVPQIIDLSELRDAHVLFEKTIATAVIFAYNTIPDKNHVLTHIGVKRTKTTKERLFFEIDHYDMHPVSQEVAENDLAIWKSNLMGGNQLYYLVNRLRQLRTLGDFIKDKKEKNGWIYGEGYQVAKRTNLADHLTGKLKVETKDITEEGIIKTCIETETKFQWSREPNKLMFKAPHIIVKERFGSRRFIAHYLDYDLIFKDDVVGIHSPKGQENELIKIINYWDSYYSILKMYALANSAKGGIHRSGGYILNMKDIFNLPYPENEGDLKLSYHEEIIKEDVLNYKLEELSKGEKAKINIQTVSESELMQFGEAFCNSLNPIYQNGNKSFNPLTPIQTLSYTCFPFAYGDDNFRPQISTKIQDGDLSELMENQNESVHYRRVLRLYQKDIVFLIKPNTLKYWLKSIALRDASDVMNDFINSGY
ncbi:HsdM family class I SAM-dependent methyltransferase [Plebeiibacterium marinum]|uniref:site-specific DNA-methyltransferase (adenine-specific) n=1 Tax=Plebeiibacterium marinum TaxID=2992111 RepID=A0AAE3MEP8_9BACT|nr:N-6 DNA methylase [Plebeiobacterium marinum]MCW3806086.1 SAM-dependent methyltransferase [Plebeiobacterium marinum]